LAHVVAGEVENVLREKKKLAKNTKVSREPN